MGKYEKSLRNVPFKNYGECMDYFFDCVNRSLDLYLADMKTVFASGQGGYKNVLYPDLEIASDVCKAKLENFELAGGQSTEEGGEDEAEEDDDESMAIDEELLDLFSDFSGSVSADEEEKAGEEKASAKGSSSSAPKNTRDIMEYIGDRAVATLIAGIRLPFYELCKKLNFSIFTVYTFASAVLSSTQTDYAGVFQIVNENGNLSSPTIESAARVYYGVHFSITGAYGEMS
ncbi:MAG: hypothetical protein IJU50_09300, partial [Lachnospiraceae bacterium]|nr:hypothetical protein [Lachnospiraceae bacterium]